MNHYSKHLIIVLISACTTAPLQGYTTHIHAAVIAVPQGAEQGQVLNLVPGFPQNGKRCLFGKTILPVKEGQPKPTYWSLIGYPNQELEKPEAGEARRVLVNAMRSALQSPVALPVRAKE